MMAYDIFYLLVLILLLMILFYAANALFFALLWKITSWNPIVASFPSLCLFILVTSTAPSASFS